MLTMRIGRRKEKVHERSLSMIRIPFTPVFRCSEMLCKNFDAVEMKTNCKISRFWPWEHGLLPEATRTSRDQAIVHLQGLENGCAVTASRDEHRVEKMRKCLECCHIHFLKL